MHNAPLRHVSCRRDAKGGHLAHGFSLLEMMMVVALVLMAATTAIPTFRTAIVRSREAVLRDHLYTMRILIDEFTRDFGHAHLSLRAVI